jgi:hypothetical protein
MPGWVIKRGAREVPIPDEATLRKWADEGRFNPSDLIFHPHLQRWLYAQDVLEIRGAFQNADSTRSSAPVSGASSPVNPGVSSAAANEFIVKQAGQEFRAPDISTVRTWAHEGRVFRDSYVFHPLLNRWVYAHELGELENTFKKTPTNISNLAVGYRQLVLWVGVQIVMSLGLLLFDFLALILVPALAVTVVALAFYAYRTAEALGSSVAPLWAVAMLIPCINIITLLVLSSKATAVCRANGVPVGFFGPSV